MTKIILIGLGEIADSHIPAIEMVPDAKVVAAVDLKPREVSFRNHPVPVYTSIATAYAEHRADIVVVATSTPSHYDVCREVYALPSRPKRIFIEKPVADQYDKVERLFSSSPNDTHLEPLFHFGFSPEVLWSSKNLAKWTNQFGPVTNLQGVFDDPRHGPDKAAKRAALGNSWIDWGINALSIIQRLVQPQHLTVTALEPVMDYEATFRFESAGQNSPGTIFTSWTAQKPIFQTELTFESGAKLHINHFDVSAELKHNSKLVANFVSDGTPRRLSHYINMYSDMLGENRLSFDSDTALNLHRLLYQQIPRTSSV